MIEPDYEIWGGWTDDAAHGAEAEHLEDCLSLSEAQEAVEKYQKNGGRYAFIKDKNTGRTI